MLGALVMAAVVAYTSWSPSIPVQVAATQQPPAPATEAVPEKGWPPAGVTRPGGSVVAPKVIKEAKPTYTPEAMSARIQGSVLLEAVVNADGTVGEVRVKRSLDSKFGLDEQAVKALRKWRFAPGTKDGVAVPVLVEVEMTFTTRK